MAEPQPEEKKRKTKARLWRPYEQLLSDAAIFAVGRRGAGKTTAIKALCYEYYMRKCIEAVVAMSSSEGNSGELASYIPLGCIYYRYDEEALIKLLTMQNHYLEARRHAIEEGLAEVPEVLRVLLITDDCGDDEQIFRRLPMRETHLMGRHRNLVYINGAQNVYDVTKRTRANYDFVICFMDLQYETLETLHNNYFRNYFPTTEGFRRFYFRATADNAALVVRYRNDRSIRHRSYSPTEVMRTNFTHSVFVWRVKPVTETFMLGRPIFNRLSKYYKINRAAQPYDPQRAVEEYYERMTKRRARAKPKVPPRLRGIDEVEIEGLGDRR